MTSPALWADLHGLLVPLAECHWLLRRPCGCLQAACVASLPGFLVADENAAWEHFSDEADDPAAITPKESGFTLELVIDAKCYAVMETEWGKPCPHKEAA